MVCSISQKGDFFSSETIFKQFEAELIHRKPNKREKENALEQCAYGHSTYFASSQGRLPYLNFLQKI